jgi:hypothetical protein
MNWLNKLKVAVVQKDTVLLGKLLNDLPILSDPKEIQTALYLLEEAKKTVTELREETRLSMIKIKKNIDFLNSTAPQKQAKFDTRS